MGEAKQRAKDPTQPDASATSTVQVIVNIPKSTYDRIDKLRRAVRFEMPDGVPSTAPPGMSDFIVMLSAAMLNVMVRNAEEARVRQQHDERKDALVKLPSELAAEGRG